VRDLEEVLIVTAATFGVASGRIPGLTGTWVGRDKLAAIGVRISRWITSHGFAFNVSTNLSHFDLIVPCGITDKGVTSVSRLTGTSVPMQRVQDAVIHAIAGVFGRTPVELAERTASSPQP
jgi:lipoate-protein ligase B